MCNCIFIYLFVSLAAAAALFSDLVMEVQAGHFHSSPTHKGHPHLKKGLFCGFFPLKLRVSLQISWDRFHLPLMQIECQPPVATQLMGIPQSASTALGSSSEVRSP